MEKATKPFMFTKAVALVIISFIIVAQISHVCNISSSIIPHTHNVNSLVDNSRIINSRDDDIITQNSNSSSSLQEEKQELLLVEEIQKGED